MPPPVSTLLAVIAVAALADGVAADTSRVGSPPELLDARLALAARRSRPVETRRETVVRAPLRPGGAIEVRDLQSGVGLRASLRGTLGADTRTFVRAARSGVEDF